MSAPYSDSYDSRPATTKKKAKPPFKLCFSKGQQIGRSDACTSKANGLKFAANLIAPKFYSKETENARNVDVSDTVEQIEREENKSPRKSYRLPLLTSHTYGWWHDKGIRPNDPRCNFHKRTSELVSFQMKIYVEDRKLKGLKC